MKISILTLFPEMITPIINSSIIKRAREKELIDFKIINYRDFSKNKHKTVDDTPYGGGAGMVLSVEPIYNALISIDDYKSAYKILLTPQGKTYNQSLAKHIIKKDHIILICGHYEGFDERIREFIDIEISIGDYVLTGGEIAALAIVDSLVRLLPGAIGDSESYINDSFYKELLDYPQYTKPREFQGLKVPDVLLSGNHKLIDEWRKNKQIERTKKRRPDLYKKYQKNVK
ncbi:MAG: tRNA (guanosine(37)-N1)-methyltransferase TrmD [Bacillota bacterium]